MGRITWLAGAVLLSLTTTWAEAQPMPTDELAERAKAWVEVLKTDDPDDHALAAAKLIQIGDAARPALVRAHAQAPDAGLRARVKAILKQLPPPKPPARPAEPPPAEPRPAEPPADLPAEEVEVHAIGAYGFPGSQFELMRSHSSGVDWVGFCELLVAQGNDEEPRFTKRLWTLLIPSARNIAQDAALIQAADDVLHNRRQEMPNERLRERLTILSRDLEAVLGRFDLIQPGDRIPKGLHAEAAALLKEERPLSILERRYLNRRMFEAAFGGFVKPTDFTLARNIAHVKVGRTKLPVILVLTCNDSARWQVTASPDARIARIIVGGNDPQDVVGTSARVDYYVYKGPARVGPEPRVFHGYPGDETNFGNVRAAIKKITGREIDSVQGGYSLEGKEPFVIGELQPRRGERD